MPVVQSIDQSMSISGATRCSTSTTLRCYLRGHDSLHLFLTNAISDGRRQRRLYASLDIILETIRSPTNLENSVPASIPVLDQAQDLGTIEMSRRSHGLTPRSLCWIPLFIIRPSTYTEPSICMVLERMPPFRWMVGSKDNPLKTWKSVCFDYASLFEEHGV